MNIEPVQFYKEEKERFEARLKEVKKQLFWLSVFRFFAFFTTVFFVYYFLGEAQKMFFSGVLGAVLFGALLIKHTNLQRRKRELLALVNINAVELQVLKGDYLNLDKGEEFLDPLHFFSYDIDLFGKGSFFQFINRTVTKAGKIKLANYLKGNSIGALERKQDAIKELSEKPKWRQKFSAVASLIEVETSPVSIVKWIKEYQAFLPKIIRFVPQAFSLISVGIMIAMYFELLVFSHLLIWFFIGLAISGVYLSKVSKVYSQSTKAKETFQQYYQLLEFIEENSFKSELLRENCQKTHISGQKSSQILKQFSKAIDALDQRNNIFFGVLGNGLFLWDIKQVFKIERWIEKYGKEVEKWFEVVSFFDSENTLANFAFNHPSFVYPEIVTGAEIINAEGLGHPLLLSSKRVTSNCLIKSQEFFIVTGANMAGKSTFLRTISLCVVMANSGLPVCASKIKYSPVRLITSMRTSDSLVDDASYFFSELKRLKFIVEALKKGHYFIILDEILKGTNSTDKAIGSQKFVEKLIASKATGIIATHDLSLCEIEKEYTQIKNHYFDAEIINDELFFDYKLKQGICQNMNASFLLRKMEIV